MTPFLSDPQLDAWLGPWRFEVAKGDPLRTGWYESGLHHAVLFDWRALGEAGEAALRARFGKVFAGLLGGKGTAVAPRDGKRAPAKGLAPIALVSREPLATPLDRAPGAAVLFASKADAAASPVLLLQHDALSPVAFVVAARLADLGLRRAAEPAPAASAKAKEKADTHLKAGRIDEAIEQYRQALLLDWTNGRALNNYGRALAMAGENAAAAALFRLAVRVAPGEITAMLSLVVHLRNLEQDEEARWWAKQAERLGAGTPDEKKFLRGLLDSFA